MKQKSDGIKVLYHKGKSGNIYSWRAWLDGPRILTEYGLRDGKKQITHRDCYPKNTGKANATTAEKQAEKELAALYVYQLERKYSETVEGAMETQMFPMLAKDFQKEKSKITYPVDVQPKLDGVRCLAYYENGDITLLSRGGKPYNVPHIKKQVMELFQSMGIDLDTPFVLDGELYCHGETFQTITSWVKKLRPETSKIQYWVYDVAFEGMSWFDRRSILSEIERYISKDSISSIKAVKTVTAGKEEYVMSLQSEFIGEGYEGAIVRTMDHAYQFGYRCNGLLKVKTFKDAEYEIIGFTSGEGSYDGCVIWECLDEATGKTFRVNPKGTFEQKKEWFLDGKKYVGEMLKVKYFELTDDGLPRFPVGIGFRMKEDM